MSQPFEIVRELENEIRGLFAPTEEFEISSGKTREQQIAELLKKRTEALDPNLGKRVRGEFDGLGPLQALMDDPAITEIIVNGPEQIWFERNGVLESSADQFASALSYLNFCHRLLNSAGLLLNSELPVAQGNLGHFRLHVIGADLTKTFTHICLRRHPDNPWTFRKLRDQGWGTDEVSQAIETLLKNRLNFLVIGCTGSGKTSVLNACLQAMNENERCVLIEDTLELRVPNKVSMRMLTREDPNGILRKVDQSDLVKNALRLRPDRIVMGEVRGEEAKDFLMALSTGHAGSFGSLHASTAAQALIRLEMLIQLGAPNWSLLAIRRLIQMSLQAIIVVHRSITGERTVEGIYRLSSLEDTGICLEKVRSDQVSKTF